MIISHTQKTLPKSQIELTISVAPDQYAAELQKAAKRLSAQLNIKGFRKGHAPFDMVKREVGDMGILQEALQNVVQKAYVTAVEESKLDVIGMPEIDVKKMAPENPIEFTATVSLLPKVTLPDVSQIKVQRNQKPTDPKQVEETIDMLRGMHAVEVIKEGPAEGTNKLVLDMNMTIDNVPVEGGQAKDYQVYLGEKHYIPGFNEQVAGLKKGDEKEFELDFPKDHYQKNLAGKCVTFSVKVKDVFDRQLPEMNEDFCKKLGQESVEKLTQLVQSNLEAEARQKADQTAEIEILEKMIEQSTFEDVPDVIIDSEREKMFYELSRDLERNGITIEQYLNDIKKDEKQIYEDFKEQATKRAKGALVSRQIAKENNIRIEHDELDREIEVLKQTYKDDEDAQKRLETEEVRNAIATQMQNRKVMQWLKAKILGEQIMNDPNLADMGCQDCKHDPEHEHSHEKNHN